MFRRESTINALLDVQRNKNGLSNDSFKLCFLEDTVFFFLSVLHSASWHLVRNMLWIIKKRFPVISFRTWVDLTSSCEQQTNWAYMCILYTLIMGIGSVSYNHFLKKVAAKLPKAVIKTRPFGRHRSCRCWDKLRGCWSSATDIAACREHLDRLPQRVYSSATATDGGRLRGVRKTA